MADEKSTPPPPFSGRLSGRIAGVVHQSVVAGKAKMAPHTRSLAANILEDFFSLVSTEVRGTIGPVLGKIADHPDSPPWVKSTFQFLSRGNGQWQTMLAGTAVGAAMSGGIGNLITNEMNPAILKMIAADPNGSLPADVAAKAEAVGVELPGGNATEAAMSGINSERFAVLTELARQVPDLGTILDLLNRDLIDENYARSLMRRAGLTSVQPELLLATRRAEIPPASLASLVTFGVMTEAEGAKMAARSGMTTEDFHTLVLGNGEPPSTQDLLFAYRRGVINRDRLFKGIEQGPLRNEWFDVVESMGQVPMSTADAIQAAVQGHISQDQAATIARQNGLMPEHFQPLMETAGSPPGPSELLDMLNRGILTEADVRQALKATRLKNQYIDAVLENRHRLPTMAEIRSLYRNAAIDKATALKYMAMIGYSGEIAEAFLADAHNQRNKKQRDLTESQIMALYSARAITPDDTKSALSALGYDDTEIASIIELADLDRLIKFTNAAIARVHSEYVTRRIDTAAASMTMDRLGIPATQRDDLLALWELERGTYNRPLTEAQLIAALKKKIISADEVQNRLEGMGYSADDASILIAMAAPASQT